jgi:hypothetical protein
MHRTFGNVWFLAKQYHSRLSECPYHIGHIALELCLPCDTETKREHDEFTSASQLEYLSRKHASLFSKIKEKTYNIQFHPVFSELIVANHTPDHHYSQ